MKTPHAVKSLFAVALVGSTPALLSCGGGTTLSTGVERTRPRLVLFVVADQLRPDVLEQARPRLVLGGFRRVMGEGTGLPTLRVDRLVELSAVAPTLAALLGIPPPSGSSGVPLGEILGGRRVR